MGTGIRAEPGAGIEREVMSDNTKILVCALVAVTVGALLFAALTAFPPVPVVLACPPCPCEVAR